MTVARAGQIVVAVNPDGSNIGSGAAVTVSSGTVTATPFKTTSVATNSAPVTSPGALATLSTLAAPPAGIYSIEAIVNVGGTTAAADFSNVTIAAASTTVRVANGTGASCRVNWLQQLSGAQAVTAATVGAGTAGSIYGVTIIATQVS